MSEDTREYTKLEGNAAIDAAMDFRIWVQVYGYAITEENNCWDCDSARYIHEDEHPEDIADMLWTLLLYRDQPERISCEFISTIHGNPDNLARENAYVVIDTGDAGEPATTTFRIYPTEIESE